MKLNTGSGQDIQRRTLIGGALAALLPSRAAAQGVSVPHDPFILLLQGIYQAVPPVISANGNGLNLGLTTVTIDSSFFRTLIYPVFGIAGSPNEPIGNFYAQFVGNLCAYDLPGGAIAMQFINGKGAAVQRNSGFETIIPDKVGGYYLKGPLDLKILEATGVYSSFFPGHNHMVDTLHQLPDGNFDEYCFCHISGKGR